MGLLIDFGEHALVRIIALGPHLMRPPGIQYILPG